MKLKTITLIVTILFLFTYGIIYAGSIKISTKNTKTEIISVVANQKKTLTNDLKPNGITSNKKPKKKILKNKHLFSMTEIRTHHTKNDCYLVINNKVYNVTSYLDKHPGGAQTIIDECGNEVTGVFAGIHSNNAWDLLAKYKIGSIN